MTCWFCSHTRDRPERSSRALDLWQSRFIVSEHGPLSIWRPQYGGGLNWSMQHFILERKDGVCGDGSEISSRVHCGRENGVVGSLEARRVVEGDRTSFW